MVRSEPLIMNRIIGSLDLSQYSARFCCIIIQSNSNHYYYYYFIYYFYFKRLELLIILLFFLCIFKVISFNYYININGNRQKTILFGC